MGFLSSILDKLRGAGSSGGRQTSLQDAIVGLLSHSQGGGIGGLLDTFKGKGLGDIFSSWISTGPNQAVTPEQIIHALGSDRLGRIAKKTGLSHKDAAHGLSTLLPEIIDKLTPQGNIPQGNALGEGLNALKNLLGGK